MCEGGVCVCVSVSCVHGDPVAWCNAAARRWWLGILLLLVVASDIAAAPLKRMAHCYEKLVRHSRQRKHTGAVEGAS